MKYITNTESEGIEDFPINSHQVIFIDPITKLFSHLHKDYLQNASIAMINGHIH